MEPVSSIIREFGLETAPEAVIPQPRPADSPLFDVELFDMERLIHIGSPRERQAWIAAIRFPRMEIRNPDFCCRGHENTPANLVLPRSEWLAANHPGALELLFARGEIVHFSSIDLLAKCPAHLLRRHFA